MPRQKPENQLESLRLQQAELAKKIKDAEEKTRTKEKEKTEHRQRIAGATTLAMLAEHPDSEFSKAFMAALNERVAKAAERELFNLPPLPSDGGKRGRKKGSQTEPAAAES